MSAGEERVEAVVEEKFAEQPGVAAGTILRCRKCDSNRIIYPTRTVDPRWMLGYCLACKKRQIIDVLLPRRG